MNTVAVPIAVKRRGQRFPSDPEWPGSLNCYPQNRGILWCVLFSLQKEKPSFHPKILKDVLLFLIIVIY